MDLDHYLRAMKEKLPIKIAAIEQTHHNEDSIGYSPEVHGYPTLVNRNNGVDSEPYNGSRDVNSLMSFDSFFSPNIQYNYIPITI